MRRVWVLCRACLKGACLAADPLPPPAVLQELPGRIWDGKEGVLVATGALSTACAGSLAPPQRRRLVAALLDAAGKKRVAYRKEGLAQLEAALLAFAPNSSGSDASGGGAVAADGVSTDAAAAAETGDFYPLVSVPLLELAGSFVDAAQGGGPMDTDSQQHAQGAAAAQQGEDEPHPGKAVPAAQVAACLGAAFATASLGTARQHVDTVTASLAALLSAAGKAADQLGAAAAGCRVAEHTARVAGQGVALSPQQQGVEALLQAALRLAEDGKASQLREQCYKLRWARGRWGCRGSLHHGGVSCQGPSLVVPAFRCPPARHWRRVQ